MPYPDQHGIFIIYKRSHKHIAGRICSWTNTRWQQGENHRDEIGHRIISAPSKEDTPE